MKNPSRTKKTVSKLCSNSAIMIRPTSDTSFSVNLTSPYTELVVVPKPLVSKTDSLLPADELTMVPVSSLLWRKGEIDSKSSPTRKWRSWSLRNRRSRRRNTARLVRGSVRNSSEIFVLRFSVIGQEDKIL